MALHGHATHSPVDARILHHCSNGSIRPALLECNLHFSISFTFQLCSLSLACGHRIGYASDLSLESETSLGFELGSLSHLSALITAPGCLATRSCTPSSSSAGASGVGAGFKPRPSVAVNQAVLQAVASGGCALIPVPPTGEVG